MLNRFELLFSIVGGWIISILIIIFFKFKNKAQLPKGSVIIDSSSESDETIIPGYNPLLLIGMGSISLLIVLVVFLCIFDFWSIFARYFAIDIPVWLNWIGILGILAQDCWGGLVFAYNVNYTPAYKPMKNKYVLATGGPYRIIRHPMYIGKSLLVIFFFLGTGIWFSFFGMISWFVLPSQAKKEEDALLRKFGKRYEVYTKKTGKFFPKKEKL